MQYSTDILKLLTLAKFETKALQYVFYKIVLMEENFDVRLFCEINNFFPHIPNFILQKQFIKPTSAQRALQMSLEDIF